MQLVAPKHKFSFQGKLYPLDATVINLCLSVFPWAEFRQKKGAIKLHMGLDAGGFIPAFMNMTSGKVHEISWAKTLKLPKGSFVCFDRGFTDYAWYNDLIINSIFFVTHLKRAMPMSNTCSNEFDVKAQASPTTKPSGSKASRSRFA